ncbi:MAG: hypothetical protein WAW92_03660 [Minisyncoccia bacterium]
MEPKFQSSFIPKKPVVDSPRMAGPVEKNVNIFSAVATLLFLLTIMASAGLFGYLKYIENQISSSDKQLTDVRSAFQESRIQELIDASIKLNAIKTLLEQHVVASQILVLLQNETLKNVRFDNLIYSNTEGKPYITLDSESLSYNAIANQRNVFTESGFLANVEFSNFVLTDSGSIKSRMKANILPRLISYKEYINSNSDTQQ